MSNGIADLRRYEEGGSVPGRLWDRARGLSSTRAGAFAGMLPIIGEGTDLLEIGAGAEDFIKRDKSDAVRRMLLGLAGLALPFASAATIKRLTPRISDAYRGFRTRPPPRTPTKNVVEMSEDPDFLRIMEEQRARGPLTSNIYDDPDLQVHRKLRDLAGKDWTKADLERWMKSEGIDEFYYDDVFDTMRRRPGPSFDTDTGEIFFDRGVRHPNDYASLEDYIAGVEADMDKLNIPRELNGDVDLRGVRNPKDYASYDDYMSAVEMDLEDLNIPPEGFGGNLKYDVDTGDYYYDFSEEGGFMPPGYDPDDPFFGFDENFTEHGIPIEGVPPEEFQGIDLDPPDPYTTPYYDQNVVNEPYDVELPDPDSMEEVLDWLRKRSGRYFRGKKRFDFDDDLPF